MAIKSPETYSDWYWKNSVEASAAYDEQMEIAFAPFFARVLADLPDITDESPSMQSFINALSTPPSAGFGGFALGVGVEMIDETLHTLMNPMMKMMARSINRRARETWLTAAQSNILFSRGKIDEPYWLLNTQSEGYEDIIGKQQYLSELPYPLIPDLILWARYHGDPANTRGLVWEKFDVPAEDYEVWDWLALQRLTTEQTQTLYKRGLLSETDLNSELARIGWQDFDRTMIEELSWAIPNAMLLVQGGLIAGRSTDELLRDISIADINPKYAQTYMDAVLTKPSVSDITAYQLRHDPDLSGLPAELRKIGVHPDYVAQLKELAYIIPPVGDIITMAVREAFTPEIAARFGQYEDFPKPFAEWAAKKGLSNEWAERYWASHWTLPSATQGFEMLHRGAIRVDELNMLLRALDIMPFWRDKLTRIAYRRLSRVDIRRMYRLGVLSEEDVYAAYLELGYNERDAKRMTDFTVKQTLETLSKFTSRDVVSAYVKRMIDATEARSLLGLLGVKSRDMSFILSTADYKRSWELTENRISGIRNLYKRRVYDLNKTESELLKLDLPAEQVAVLMEQWYYEIKEEVPRHWTTAQVLGFAKEGLITRGRAEEELYAIGYDKEHVDVYIRTLV